MPSSTDTLTAEIKDVWKVVTLRVTLKTYDTLVSPCNYFQRNIWDVVVAEAGLPAEAQFQSCTLQSVSTEGSFNFYICTIVARYNSSSVTIPVTPSDSWHRRLLLSDSVRASSDIRPGYRVSVEFHDNVTIVDELAVEDDSDVRLRDNAAATDELALSEGNNREIRESVVALDILIISHSSGLELQDDAGVTDELTPSIYANLAIQDDTTATDELVITL